MSKLSKNLLKLSINAGGSFKTRDDRNRHVAYFCDFLREQNINIEHVSDIKAWHIERYVTNRKAIDQVSEGTICNEIANIKKVLREAGRHQLADLNLLNNKSLEITGRKRIGNKLPISAIELNELINKAIARDAGVACCLLLAFQLGMRKEEACQGYKSVETWLKNVVNNDARLTILYGTKGGRPREAVILHHEILLQTLLFCRSVIEKRNGYLIDEIGLKDAMTFLANSASAIGLVDEHSFHALRYTYANLLYLSFETSNFSEEEKYSLISCALGHSSGRGKYVKSVYCRNLLSEEQLNFNDLVINYPPLN